MVSPDLQARAPLTPLPPSLYCSSYKSVVSLRHSQGAYPSSACHWCGIRENGAGYVVEMERSARLICLHINNLG